MMTARHKRVCFWVGGPILLALTVWIGINAVTKQVWVGGTDLEIEFVVKNARNGEPIPGAELMLQSPQFGNPDAKPNILVLTTDRVGRYHWFEKGTGCTGTSSWWQETRNVHLPEWYYWVSAPGYYTTAPETLQKLWGRTWRGKDRDYLTVEILLHPRER
jgi:hypothetical protein